MTMVRTKQQYKEIVEALYPDATPIIETVGRDGNPVTSGAAVALIRSCPELTMTEATIIIREWLADQPQMLNE